MIDTAERARVYRERANELRALATEIRDEEQRTLLHSVADDYEQMAAKAISAW